MFFLWPIFSNWNLSCYKSRQCGTQTRQRPSLWRSNMRWASLKIGIISLAIRKHYFIYFPLK